MGYRIGFFDLWRPGYGAAIATIYVAGTTTPADVFTDEALTAAAVNPQTLDEKTIFGISYGKWQVPLYTAQSIEIVVDTGDRTGIVRPPIYSLDGAEGSGVLVQSADGAVARALEDRAADFVIAVDSGAFGAVPATNTAILQAAIGVASGRGGDTVYLPAGTIRFTAFNIPGGVVLEGKGRGVTILESETADRCITIGGDGAGFRRLTIDGANVVPDSVGLFAKAKNEIVMDDVEVKRFDTGIHAKGGRRNNWRQLFIENCNYGVKLHGDEDAGAGADGDEFRNNSWRGGMVTNCLEIGVELSFEDKRCWHNQIHSVGFENNAGTALNINGARYTRLPGCWWTGNTVDIAVDDDDDTDNAADNTVIGLHVIGATLDGGELTFAGHCQDVGFDRCEISGAAITLTQPTNNIVATDCVEDDQVIISETGERWLRRRSTEHAASSGITLDATGYTGWSMELAPGQVGYFKAIVIGNQRNADNTGEYSIAQSARRPGSLLQYDTQTVNWTLGEIITGGTSEATARVVKDTDAGGSGTLEVRDISGEFINGEALTGSGGGRAVCVGTLTGQDAELLGTILNHRIREDVAGWGAIFTVDGPEVRVQVTGAAAATVEWLIHVDAIVT